MPRFLENSFLCLDYVFSVQVLYICLNLIDLSKKVHFVYSKQNVRPKNCFLEIGASNLKGPLLKFQYSTKHLKKDKCLLKGISHKSSQKVKNNKLSANH